MSGDHRLLGKTFAVSRSVYKKVQVSKGKLMLISVLQERLYVDHVRAYSF